MATTVRFRYDQRLAAEKLGSDLAAMLEHMGLIDRPLLVLCIGTDRSTGDALGPLVGQRLQEALPFWEGRVLGTLDCPIHAGNLADVLADLRCDTEEPVIVAVDACLGRAESVGTVCIAPGPLLPGAGVNKSLPEVGVAHVTGTVNVGGFMEYFVLQNTRLHLVMSMAAVIAEGVAHAARLLRDARSRPALADAAPL